MGAKSVLKSLISLHFYTQTLGKDWRALLLIVTIVRIVVIPRATLAGAAFGDIQNETHDIATTIDDGIQVSIKK